MTRLGLTQSQMHSFSRYSPISIQQVCASVHRSVNFIAFSLYFVAVGVSEVEAIVQLGSVVGGPVWYAGEEGGCG